MKNLAISLVLGALLLGGMQNAVTAEPNRTSTGAKEQTGSEPPIENAWPVLTDEQQAESVAELKAFAEKAATKLDRPLKMFETKLFLFYSDLPRKEAANWAGLLDRMYAKLAEMFAVPKGENIWRGKALVFVFEKKDDYQRYEREMANTDPGATAGMCHSSRNGIVKIAFYRQPDELEFAHVLVHESVHGFVHRYRTPVNIPSWVNEGLAETTATDLVPQRGRRDMVKTKAREGLQQHKGEMAGFFRANHIDAWQYPVAEMMCTFMIQAGNKNYVAFIKALKDKMNVDDALTSGFKAPREKLVAAFGEWLGVKNLEP